MMTKLTRLLLPSCAVAAALAGCGTIPYRVDGLVDKPECRRIYDAYDDISPRNKSVPDEVLASPCWRRAKEERDDYDLLIVEFDDQGWAQGTSDLTRPARDHLDTFFGELDRLYKANPDNGLSLVVFVHGWHHNADARDANVSDFRLLLRDLVIAEKGRKASEVLSAARGPRVVGVYVGWRGESITVPGLRQATFWERKNTAERVAQGSVREFFARMDFLRDRGRDTHGERNVRMLTIGHSFGGLITFESLSSDFLRAAVRSTGEAYVSRLGDIVVIVNPAFEGARYEPLLVAGQRMTGVKKDQLPVAIVATSTADEATGTLFPMARRVSTIFETTPGAEGDAIVKAVGHNDRYTTHRLAVCDKDDAACASTCRMPQVRARETTADIRRMLEQDIGDEYRLMRGIGQRGFKAREYLCNGLKLESTANWVPNANPFWVVSTTGDIMKDHNDIFNARFVSFIRQMYLGVIAVRFPRKE